MKSKTPCILFLLVLTVDFAQSLFNFVRYFESREDNLSVALFSLLHFLPLVVLAALSRKVLKIEGKTRLSVIQKCLVAYLALDVILGLVAFQFSLPRPLGFLFYSKNWWFCIVYMICYEQYGLAVDLAIDIFYWVSYGVLLAGISAKVNPSESEIDLTENGKKTSASFKIAVANMILLVVQTAITGAIMAGWSRAKAGTTGMQAIGLVFVALILIAAKFVFSLPNLILSVVGIVKSRAPVDKARKHSKYGLWINIACLVICEAEVFLWW